MKSHKKRTIITKTMLAGIIIILFLSNLAASIQIQQTQIQQPLFSYTNHSTHHQENMGASSPIQLQWTLEFSAEDLSIITDNEYTTIFLTDTTYHYEPDQPLLPQKTIYIALPTTMKVSKLYLVSYEEQIIPGAYILPIAIAPQPILNQPEKTVASSQTIAVPETLSWYPTSYIHFIGQADLAGQPFAELAIYPVHYHPQLHQLKLLTTITFMVEGDTTYVCGDYLPASLADSSKKYYEQTIKDMVINPDDVILTVKDTLQPLGVPPGDYDYVIITQDSFVSSFEPLKHWKTKKGIPATIVTTSWIYNSGGYSGTNQQKIKAFVQDAHTTWGSMYFLLGGDTSIVPYYTDSFYLPGHGILSVPSDSYYGDYDRDWVCEVHMGRAPVTTTAQISVFINKTLSYEKNPPLASYAKKAALFGFDLDSSTPGEQCKITIDNSYIPSNWTMSNVYDSHTGDHEQNVKNAVNAGQHLINHADHSNYDSMGVGYTNHGDTLSISEVDAFSNGNKQSILYSMGCWSNAIDYDAISEHFIKDTNGGGIAFIGNTRYGWYNPGYTTTLSMLYDQYFFRSLFAQNHYILGDCFSDHKNDGPTSNNYEKYIFAELTLLGDPGLPIWTEDPATLVVTHPSTAPLGASIFTVQAQTTTGGAVPTALVCLWKGTEIYTQGYTNSAGTVSFSISPPTVGVLNVTVTKHNYLPSETTAQIIPSGNSPPIAIDDTVTVDEDSSNNFFSVLLNDYDPDGDPLSIVSITQPSHGVASFNTTHVFYTPSGNYYGFDSLTYTISDGFGGSDTALVNITVSGVNDPPIAMDDYVVVIEDSQNNEIDVLANDVDFDGDSLTVISFTNPSHGVLVVNGSMFEYTPEPDYFGDDQFTYTISDGNNGTDTASVFITVTPVQDDPVALDDTFIVDEDTVDNQLDVLGNDFDVDGDNVTISEITQPSHGTASTDGLYVYYSPFENFTGSDLFTYTITDGNNGFDSATVFLTVADLNDPPMKPAQPSGPTSGQAGQQYIYTTVTTDPENSTVSYLFDWGDGTTSPWLGPYPSGEIISAPHIWVIQGNYSIKVKAKDSLGAESEWSDPLPISMPLLFPYHHQLFFAIQQLKH